jgi:hypothetical protein
MAKLPKKPNRPKMSSSIRAWENFDARMKAWHKKIADLKSAKTKKAALIKKYAGK